MLTSTTQVECYCLSEMGTRPFRPRPRRDRDVGHYVREETETRRRGSETRPRPRRLQLPRPWPRCMVKTIRHHKYLTRSREGFHNYELPSKNSSNYRKSCTRQVLPSAKYRPTRLAVDAALRRIGKSRHGGHKIANISCN